MDPDCCGVSRACSWGIKLEGALAIALGISVCAFRRTLLAARLGPAWSAQGIQFDELGMSGREMAPADSAKDRHEPAQLRPFGRQIEAEERERKRVGEHEQERRRQPELSGARRGKSVV